MCAININTDIETTVVIEWESVQPWQKYAEKNTQNDSGIYQITGNHVVFGDNSLLYILGYIL